MQVKSKKNFKFFSFIFLICFCFVFKISNVSALVYKTSLYGSISGGSLIGQLSNGSNRVHNITFNDPITSNVVNGFDLLVIKFGNFSLTTGSGSSVSSSSSFTCTSYQTSQNGDITCATGGLTSYNNTTDGNIYIQSAIFYDNNTGVKDSCYFSSELQDMIICPMSRKNSNVTGMEINIRNGGFGNLSYNISVNSLKYAYNYDSTEIVNGLNGVQQAQVNTTTTIQNFNNYVSNTDTTEAETNQTTALGSISNTFNTHMSKANELTQFFLIPINFMVNISNNTCKPLVWDIPFVNTRVQIPCMSTIYNSYFSTFISVFSLIMTSLLGYRSMLKLFNAIKGMVDAEDDKVEVVDL